MNRNLVILAIKLLLVCALAMAATWLLNKTVFAEDITDNDTVELIGYRSGFIKAQNGNQESITIGELPESWGVDSGEWLRPAVDAWNAAAGWELFRVDLSGANTDVQFSDTATRDCPSWSGGCTGWQTFPNGRYMLCTVAFYPWQTTRYTMMHELGHCLGFRDVTVLERYVGIMSYKREPHTTPMNPQDVASLRAAGYIPSI